MIKCIVIDELLVEIKFMQVIVSKEELYSMIKKAVRDVIREEKMELVLKRISEASSEEVNDITTTYGKPSKRKAVRKVAIDI